jgi:hypothetical protein
MCESSVLSHARVLDARAVFALRKLNSIMFSGPGPPHSEWEEALLLDTSPLAEYLRCKYPYFFFFFVVY